MSITDYWSSSNALLTWASSPQASLCAVGSGTSCPLEVNYLAAQVFWGFLEQLRQPGQSFAKRIERANKSAGCARSRIAETATEDLRDQATERIGSLQRAQKVQDSLLLRWAERVEVVDDPVSF